MTMPSRRRFLTSAALGSLSVLGVGGRAGPAGGRRRMNVLFFAVDDLRPQLGCYGRKGIRSPHMDGLARAGLRFDRAYCQQAVCAPSRISLLSGRRPDTCGIYGLSTPLVRKHPEFVTLPQHFRRHGYQAVSLGKIYHHRSDDPKGWSTAAWAPSSDWAGGWRAYRDPASAAVCKRRLAEARGQWEAAKKAGRKAWRLKAPGGPAFEGPDVPDGAYPDGMVADKAIAELRRLKDKAFFLAVGFVKPHLPFNAPRKYWDLYDPRAIELPSNTRAPLDAPELALTHWGELRAYAGIPRQGPVDAATARQLIHGYQACVSYTDAQVGRVVAELDRLGLRDRTIIILWGDHGWKLGEYSAWCKHTNFELDTHVPMILSVPGQRSAGQATDALVEFVDIYPTLAELCGLPVPEHCEGTSMAPLLDDPARAWKQAAFSQYPRGSIMGYTLRTARWRYTEWIERPAGTVRARELYDHQRDPGENRNVAAAPEHADVVRRLSALLDRGQGWRKLQKPL